MKRSARFIIHLLCTMVSLTILLTGCLTKNSEQQVTSPEPQTETTQPSEPEPAEEIIEPAVEEEPAPEPEPEPEITYILNKNTKKFHKPTCRSAEQISPKNYEESYAAREEIVAQGYSPCGNCKP